MIPNSRTFVGCTLRVDFVDGATTSPPRASRTLAKSTLARAFRHYYEQLPGVGDSSGAKWRAFGPKFPKFSRAERSARAGMSRENVNVTNARARARDAFGSLGPENTCQK